MPGGGGQFGSSLTTDSGRWLDVGLSFVSNAGSSALADAGLKPLTEWLLQQSLWHWLDIEVRSASRRSIRAPLQRLLREGAGDTSIARRLARGRLSHWSGLVRLADDSDEWISRLARRGVSVEARNVARGVWGLGPRHFTVGDLVRGVGADFAVGIAWQLGEDLLTHPELLNQPDLLARRALAGGLTNATAGVIGQGIVGILAFGIVATGGTVSAPFVLVGGFIAAVAVDVIWGEQIGEQWSQKLDARGPWE